MYNKQSSLFILATITAGHLSNMIKTIEKRIGQQKNRKTN